jgi:two-component system nitrogen regulation response regulator GlnG
MNAHRDSRSAAEVESERRKRVALVVDDEPSICWAFERMLTEDGHQVITASSAEEGLAVASQHDLDLVLLDVRLPKENGISALPKFSAVTDGCPVIVMTAFGDLETAVAAVKRGAFDYLVKPFPLEDARRVCDRALQASQKPSPATSVLRDRTPNHRIVGRSPAIQQAFRQIALVAASDLSVLITGETGTGKELVAAAIHRHSDRTEAPYIPISPISLNEDLIESELFGHVKGAFTGAGDDRQGLFERAEGGTVLLDEIGDLPINLQVKLLRVMEHGEFFRVGDITPRRCNVRLLAATNCDLHEAVRRGGFREDLFYRLNGLHIHLPPLRQRHEDIGPLCEHFLAALGDAASKEQLTEELVEQLQSRPWHGNVRELRNAVEHAAVVARGRTLTIADFPDRQPALSANQPAPEDKFEDALIAWIDQRLADESTGKLHAELIAAVESVLLRRVLQHTKGNRAAAAEILRIHRGTLREKLRLHGIQD